ncbi:MAG: hypothetical protein WBG48_06785 [Pricia sp.]
MRKSKYMLLGSMALALGASCDKSSSDEFDEVNQNAKVKLISSVSLASAQDTNENEKVNFSYDDKLRLSSINTGADSSEFVYDEQGLTDVTGDEAEDNFDVEALYKSPYDAFESGDVVEYDDNKNPSKILFFEEAYDYESGEVLNMQYSAELTYEDTPSVYFHTLKAAGVIDVLDKVRLNFAMEPQAQEILKARTLLPNNNISKITYKDEEGAVMFEITTAYTYDADDYPTQVKVTSKSFEDTQESETFTMNYTYL